MTTEAPSIVAARILDEGKFLTDDSGTVHRYTGTHWEPMSDAALRAMAIEADGFKRSVGKRRSEIIDQIKGRSYRAKHQWGRVEDWEVPCRNVVVDVRTGAVRAHRPEDYLEKVIPWAYAPGAKCERFERALEEWFPGDQVEEPGALQEFAGYVVLPHARYKKALVVQGDSDTGKSLVPFVLMNLVGADRTCALPMEKMDDPIARAVIVGKQLNVMTEITVGALVADGGFKQLVSTEEPVFINEKYKPTYMYIPTAKHVFAMNELPRINDRTRAVLGRLLIVPFKRVFVGQEKDEALQAALVAEMPGILLWAIEGARRLVERRGQFAEVSAATALFAELRAEANPAIDFLKERLVVDYTNALPLTRLVDVFNRWHKGSRRATVKSLGKMLRAAGQAVKDVRVDAKQLRRTGKDSVVLKCLIGFALSDLGAPAWLGVESGSAASGDGEIVATSAPSASEFDPSGGDG